jgi:hypothetical protein
MEKPSEGTYMNLYEESGHKSRKVLMDGQKNGDGFTVEQPSLVEISVDDSDSETGRRLSRR